jgi:ABC-2 type transport system permease protein
MSIAYIGLESARQLRNARGLIFTFAIPLIMLLVFGSAFGSGGVIDKATGLPWVVVTTIQMAGYGGMMAALGQAFNIVTERSLGWNRQLRVTPLSGTGYLLSKVVAALAVSLVSIVLLILVSIVVLGANLSLLGWSMAALGLWIGVIPFALIAVLIGQFAKPSYAQPLFLIVFFGLSILGGLWIPLQIMPDWVSTIAQAVPSYWLNRLGQLGASVTGNVLEPVLVLAGWSIVLAFFIVWRYRRDSARS